MSSWAIVARDMAERLPASFTEDCERVIVSAICPPGTAYKVDPDQMRMTDFKTGESWTMRERPPT